MYRTPRRIERKICQTGLIETEQHVVTECLAYELMRFHFMNTIIYIPDNVTDNNHLFLYWMPDSPGHTEYYLLRITPIWLTLKVLWCHS